MALIALGVTGGIGAYKAVEVARLLQKRGHDVVAIMTRSARHFVGPVTFEAITRRRVIGSQWSPGANADIEHISVASDIALLLVVPATANVIGKFAHGIADDFLSSMYLATAAPVVMAPAMNSNMLAHPAVQQNLATLTARGVRFVEPGEGYLACGWIGKGRLAEPEAVVEAAEAVLRGGRRLTGRRIVVTAGPTQEDLDPVRFVGNRSSGRMGFAIAAALAGRGSDVVLIAGPSTVEPPATTKVVRVRSAADMRQAVLDALPGADALVMAAAVANYTPESVADEKIPHDTGALTIRLVPTGDILAEAASWRERQGGQRPLLVGFAAETGDVLSRARAKRLRKGIDVIVANDVSRADAGFEVDRNEVTIITADGEELLPLQSKQGIAAALADRLERVAERPDGAGRVATPMSRRDLVEHLRYYEELEVPGVSRDPAWRARASSRAVTPSAPETSSGALSNEPSDGDPPPVPLPLVTRLSAADTLAQLRVEIGDCTRCRLHSGRTHLVFGVGDPEAQLMFIGEGPGADEDLQGEPFVGRAGQLLTQIIKAMGFERDQVYIANVVKCRPPGNRNPEPDEIATCSPFLKAQIAAIDPIVIVALGKFAAQTLLGVETPISRLRGQFHRLDEIDVMPTFHPSYLLRNPAAKREVWDDMKMVMARLKEGRIHD